MTFLRKRRLKKFVDEFPNAVDIITRGVKAGLPLGDCLRIIAAESAEPVRGEFRQIVEAQTMGLSTSEAVERIVERVPLAEASFFAIVINIQQKAGGNLAEALDNLSSVLRDRKMMKGEDQGRVERSQDLRLYHWQPAFCRGHHGLCSQVRNIWNSCGQRRLANSFSGCSAVWMGIGVFIMKNMINFDI